jgi:membrane-associated phospholipid phosphatase
LIAFDGPRRLLAAFLAALILVVLNLLITTRWKISLHVSNIAGTATLVAVTYGVGASLLLLLIPLVAWARIKIGAHTLWQALAGALLGSGVSLATLYALRLI